MFAFLRQFLAEVDRIKASGEFPEPTEETREGKDEVVGSIADEPDLKALACAFDNLMTAARERRREHIVLLRKSEETDVELDPVEEMRFLREQMELADEMGVLNILISREFSDRFQEAPLGIRKGWKIVRPVAKASTESDSLEDPDGVTNQAIQIANQAEMNPGIFTELEEKNCTDPTCRLHGKDGILARAKEIWAARRQKTALA